MWCDSENSLNTLQASWSNCNGFQKGTEVKSLERKTKILLITTALLVAILSGVAALAYANSTNGDINTTTSSLMDNAPFIGGFGRGGGFGCGNNPWMTITVSQAFKDNVISIAKNDTDVQNLLNQGYNITNVKPLINATVEADGTVTMKATSAVLTLTQNTTTAQNTTVTGRALVWVNIDQAKVTRIVTMTRTVIEK